MEFADRLRALREAAGMTQAKLASSAGIDPSAVAHLEAGRRKPSFHNIRRLAKALNLSTDELLNHDGPVMAFRNAQALTQEQKDMVQSLINTLTSDSKKGP